MAKQAQVSLRYLNPDVLQKLESLHVIARQVVEGLRVGTHRSPLRGFSTEFAHHRPYAQGDEIRRLDWRIYGRTERYFVKLYEAETNFDAHLLLDASSSMRYGSGNVSKLEYAKFMAASLAYLIGEQSDAAGLAVFDAELRSYIPPSSAAGVIGRIESELEKAQPVPRTNVASILHEFARRVTRRGVVMLFSDLFDNVDGFIKGLNHLRFRKHNITVFHTLDPFELEFPFTGTCRFKGLENDGEIVTQPARVRELYLKEVQKFVAEIRRACERIQVDYVLVDTSRPLDETLSTYLLSQSGRIAVKMQ